MKKNIWLKRSALMQKIRKILGAVLDKIQKSSHGRTDGLTDGRTNLGLFIGLNQKDTEQKCVMEIQSLQATCGDKAITR